MQKKKKWKEKYFLYIHIRSHGNCQTTDSFFIKKEKDFFNLLSTLLNVLIEINVFHPSGKSPVLRLVLEPNWHGFMCPEAVVMNVFKGIK